MKRNAVTAVLLALALASAPIAADTIDKRPDSWAQPQSAQGTSNFYKVSDSLDRSAQPTAVGFRSLKDLGIVTVVNLCSHENGRRPSARITPAPPSSTRSPRSRAGP